MSCLSRLPAPARLASAAFLACLAVGPASGQTVVTAVEVGHHHACALTAAGGVKCWGLNNFGALGDGTTTDRVIPVDVAGLASGVVAIETAYFHGCAITASGGLKCWGLNDHHQLGDGTVVNRATAVDVAGLAGGVTAVATGTWHTCALLAGGGVRCWGNNDFGQLGDGTTQSRTAPTDVAGLMSGVTAIAAGEFHTCALAGGLLKCWGRNNEGQVGDGTAFNWRVLPVEVVMPPGTSASVSGGLMYTCVRTTVGGAQCWGDNAGGNLGDGTTTRQVLPVDVAGLASGVAFITAGDWSHTCAITIGGGAKCWGTNYSGELGDGSLTSRTTPTDVVSLASGTAAIRPGFGRTCALTTLGGVKCWGSNGGLLGDGTRTDRLLPTNVYGLGDADGDGLPNDAEIAEGRDALVKDNDVFTSARLFAMQQYRDYLFREGEPAGIDAWAAALLGGGISRERMVDAFHGSAEFSGFVAPVIRLYFASFQRAPDYDGLVLNARLLREGTLTRERMATYFAAGPEFLATYGTLDNTQFVTLLYANVLGRAPDAEGLAAWLALLDGGARRGEVLLGFSDSVEFQAAIANETFATMIYAGLLGRSPDPAGLPLWVAYLDSQPYLHEYAIDAVLRSAEYRARFLP